MTSEIGILNFDTNEDKFYIQFSNHTVRLSSGDVVWINVLGWKKCRIEHEFNKGYYALNLPISLKPGLKVSLYKPD